MGNFLDKIVNWTKETFGTGKDKSETSYTPVSTPTYEDFTYDPFEYEDYKEGQSVTDALDKKNNAESAVTNYGDFSFSKQNDWDSIYDQYKNRGDFSYDFNTDALYQQYKDKYIQQGKMAMADTMGQAAAMTGGYGNSYAASVGNQAYQAQLQNLNDVIPELYQMAYDRYNQKGQDMLNMLGLLGDERNFEYGTWSDGLNRAISDRDYYGTQYNNERTWDYGKYTSDRTLAHGEHTNEQNVAYENHKNAYDNEWKQAQWDEDARRDARDAKLEADKWDFTKSQSGSSSGGGGGGANDGASEFHKATFARTDENGNNVFYINGKEYTYAPGINPYTGTKNSDCKNGTFSNGYQPNNINGKKLSKSGITDVVNGVTQNVWKTPDGKLWIWDGTQNKYLQYEE